MNLLNNLFCIKLHMYCNVRWCFSYPLWLGKTRWSLETLLGFCKQSTEELEEVILVERL